MHIFLTGPQGIGKTTVIQKTLGLLGQPALAGFRTVSMPTQLPGAEAEVYLTPAQGPMALDREHLIGIRWGEWKFTAFPIAFETGGLEVLGRVSLEARLLLMDELGMMERQAPGFCRQVLAALDGPLPVLGVVKPMPLPLLDQVRAHPAVRLLEVNQENRDALPQRIAAWLGPRVQPFGR